MSFSLLPALAYVVLLFFAQLLLQKRGNTQTAIWGLVVLGSLLFFYGLTFWEHSLALLMLLPLFFILPLSSANSLRIFLAGVAYAGSIYLRPETALLMPGILYVFLTQYREKWLRLSQFGAGMGVSMILSASAEWIWAGRWMPGQIPANLTLIFNFSTIFERLEKSFQFLLSAPISPYLFGSGIVILLVLSRWFKKNIIAILGLPILSSVGLWVAFLNRSPFEITASTQGFYFAMPWAAISLLPLEGKKRRDDPFFILGWSYLLLAYLLGSDQPGMHWGPRFLFPALIPLLLRSVDVMSQIPPNTRRTIMAVTGLAALLFASSSILALAERGRAGREAVGLIQECRCPYLILDRWHEGADLEPLWGCKTLLWPQSLGDREELLFAIRRERIAEKFCWLISDGEKDEDQLVSLPVDIEREYELPNRAGWNGVIVEAIAADSSDLRWGYVYWHAARRRAEADNLLEALKFFQDAVEVLPDNADLRFDLAVCLGRMGRTGEAINELKETLRLQPEHGPALELWRRLTAR